jgi:hypothetical protein
VKKMEPTTVAFWAGVAVGTTCLGVPLGMFVLALVDRASKDQRARELSQARRAAVDAYFIGLGDRRSPRLQIVRDEQLPQHAESRGPMIRLHKGA